ncbi:isopentenyl-diphosphate Delta-isomerase 1 [Bacillus rossius redtenbacheri]|uniref:isopentenyl-diphosphate Delta-isomerase 1 n=1 Tax=Bacillus rossius redtenbacheri TaxID=93214 RepID=UPI002FDEDE26
MAPLRRMATAVCQAVRRNYAVSAPEQLDRCQEAALKENCIVVDEDDRAVGHATKRECHRVDARGALVLHRAFSVFLFNSREELLLQKRSSHKITFPSCYTNACCSHPLFDIPAEREEEAALGVRLAARRRLQHELGVSPDDVPVDSLRYLTRIHYRAEMDGGWGEHEIDYVLILHRDVTLDPNPEEVSDVLYVDRGGLDALVSAGEEPLSPWFRLIAQSHLRSWWDNLHQLDRYQDHETIHRF